MNCAAPAAAVPAAALLLLLTLFTAAGPAVLPPNAVTAFTCAAGVVPVMPVMEKREE